ncbi:MAG: hypothetical protein JSR34_04935 [Proteobacteria bacterium]|nr:hypothetical protein [Pseudomonadota bacterium]
MIRPSLAPRIKHRVLDPCPNHPWLALAGCFSTAFWSAVRKAIAQNVAGGWPAVKPTARVAVLANDGCGAPNDRRQAARVVDVGLAALRMRRGGHAVWHRLSARATGECLRRRNFALRNAKVFAVFCPQAPAEMPGRRYCRLPVPLDQKPERFGVDALVWR